AASKYAASNSQPLSRYLDSDDESDDDGYAKRVVKTQFVKQQEELEALSKNLSDAVFRDDWVVIMQGMLIRPCHWFIMIFIIMCNRLFKHLKLFVSLFFVFNGMYTHLLKSFAFNSN